jgi:hypothetical protein
MKETEAARGVLLEVLNALGAMRDDLVIVGGWVPDLLYPSCNHMGSLDVDRFIPSEVDRWLTGYNDRRRDKFGSDELVGCNHPFGAAEYFVTIAPVPTTISSGVLPDWKTNSRRRWSYEFCWPKAINIVAWRNRPGHHFRQQAYSQEGRGVYGFLGMFPRLRCSCPSGKFMLGVESEARYSRFELFAFDAGVPDVAEPRGEPKGMGIDGGLGKRRSLFLNLHAKLPIAMIEFSYENFTGIGNANRTDNLVPLPYQARKRLALATG